MSLYANMVGTDHTLVPCPVGLGGSGLEELFGVVGLGEVCWVKRGGSVVPGNLPVVSSGASGKEGGKLTDGDLNISSLLITLKFIGGFSAGGVSEGVLEE